MKVKIFVSASEDGLEKDINEFIKDIENKGMEVRDIKYTVTDWGDGYMHYSALIMYEQHEDALASENARTFWEKALEWEE